VVADAGLARRVRAAAAAWRWIPYDATTVTGAGADLVISGDHARVYGTDAMSRTPAPDLVDEARALAAEAGATSLTWVVLTAGRPADLDDVLAARGAALVEDLEVMARPLGRELPHPAGPPAIDLRLVDTPRLLSQAYELDSTVLGTPIRSAHFLRVAATVLAKQVAAGADRTQYRYVSVADSMVVATAGLTLDASVARLWGAAVLPEHRRRGHYQALLATRTRVAVRRGATLALAKARTGTSAPLLRRAGFRVYGRERHHRLTV
jgi:ribosomal protein S18 acetylase RimI-like enzyme